MKINLLELEDYLDEDVRKKLKIKNYHEDEFIWTTKDKKIVYILEGQAKAIRYEDGKEIIYPHFLNEGDFMGFGDDLLLKKSDWEAKAFTKLKCLIFEEEEAKKHIFNNLQVFSIFMKRLLRIAEKGIRGFYIHSRGGAKSHFAYLLVLNSVDGEMSYKNYVYFSQILGISESMLYRITREFIKKGLIKKSKSMILITDMDKLKKLYEEYIYD